MYTKSLTYTSDPRLVLGYMNTFSEINETRNVLIEWDKIMDKYPSKQIFIAYFQARLGMQGFDIGDIENVAIGLLKKGDKFTIIRMVCGVLFNAGYIEKSISILQAVIEYSFYKNAEIKSDANMIKEFGDFWDSECDRFGDGVKSYFIIDYSRMLLDTVVQKIQHAQN